MWDEVVVIRLQIICMFPCLCSSVYGPMILLCSLILCSYVVMILLYSYCNQLLEFLNDFRWSLSAFVYISSWYVIALYAMLFYIICFMCILVCVIKYCYNPLPRQWNKNCSYCSSRVRLTDGYIPSLVLRPLRVHSFVLQATDMRRPGNEGIISLWSYILASWGVIFILVLGHTLREGYYLWYGYHWEQECTMMSMKMTWSCTLVAQIEIS